MYEDSSLLRFYNASTNKTLMMSPRGVVLPSSGLISRVSYFFDCMTKIQVLINTVVEAEE